MGTVLAHASDPFMKPTPEELAMTSLPGYPGAAAVVLFREEIDHDDIKVVQHYERIKVLTEEGKKYANVELGFVTTSSDGIFGSNEMMVDDILARTVHADGTVIPFTGKPYLKVIEKGEKAKYQEKVFTLPDVEVGSIIEYHYSTRYSDNQGLSPDWYIQGGLYLRAAHYQWYPTSHQLVDYKERPITSISWHAILPVGVQLTHRELPATSPFGSAQQIYEVTVKDVPPTIKEDFMPPLASISYRVLFNFTCYRSAEDYWKSEGKEWSKNSNSFAEPNSDLKAATQAIIAGAVTQDDKLRKIYAAVMALENTSYTREHEKREDKAAGVGKISSAMNILSLKRGNPTQLTELFVGMARAAGMKAYLMLVPDRSEELFEQQWMNFRQFDATIAIVNVDGKEQYFDPGSRYCSYAHLPWEYTLIKGLRQTDAGTDFGATPGDSYTVNSTARIANLKMDEHGEITGSVDLTFSGAGALWWRHKALQGDEESLKHSLRKSMEEDLPKTLEVEVKEIKNLDDYEKPFSVSYGVKGTLGSATGKRLLMPVDLFRVGEAATFTQEKRELAVYFDYPQSMQDALRINFAKGFEVEALPDEAKLNLQDRALYHLSVTSTPTSFTTRRNYIRGDILYMPKDYAALRTFYSQFEGKDQESVVLKVTPTETVAPSGGN
jgi:hypothetical protein